MKNNFKVGDIVRMKGNEHIRGEVTTVCRVYRDSNVVRLIYFIASLGIKMAHGIEEKDLELTESDKTNDETPP